MMTENNDMEIQEQELVDDGVERTRECRCFIPRADIYDVNENIIVMLDMPGINENAIEIVLEKNILNVKGYAQTKDRGDYSMVIAEYEPGDFERSFRVSDGIDRDKIEANYQDGVLRLTLPLAEERKTRKITVNVGK
jgi:HSP20 family molecular chaperone IbpA